MVPADDQAMVVPCASVMVIMVLLKVAFTCATPEAIFLRSRLRTRVASLPILHPLAARPGRSLVLCPRSRLRQLKVAAFCRQSALPVPCGCRHWYWCGGRGRVVRDGAS